MKQLKILLLLLFTTAVLFGCNDSSKNDNSASTEPAKTTTFMVYVVGSDLESEHLSASSNMREMLNASNGDTNTTIIMQTGAAEHTDVNPVDNLFKQPPLVSDWSTIQLHKIHNGNLTTLENNLGKSCIEGKEVAGCISMSKGNITTFIKKAVEYAPADRYVLILWNHGGGSISGYGDQANSSTVIDIKNAVAESGIHFDIIGFDACLMSTLETAYALKDYADYFVGSEELENGFGWNYQVFLTELAADNSISSKDLAVKITEAFHKRYTEQVIDASHTLAAIDLNQIENLKNSFESYTSSMLSKIQSTTTGLNSWVEFNNARKDVEYYGEYGSYGVLHIDLQHMVTLSSTDNFGINDAIKNAVISNQTDRPNSHGISIFMPYYYELMEQMANQNLDFASQYNTLYAGMFPNAVKFAQTLIDMAVPGMNNNTIQDTNTTITSGTSNVTYSGDIKSDYGFRDANIFAYYKENQQMIAGTPFLESLQLTNETLSDFTYNITAKNGMMQFTNADNTVTITPYAVKADIQPNQNQYTYAFPVFYADSDKLECINEGKAENVEDSNIQGACNIQKYVMEVTFDNNLNIININKDLQAYNSQNSKVAAQLNPGDAVFLNSAAIGATSTLEVTFNSNNKFTIQENLTDTFKAELVKQVKTNNVELVLYAVNHAGGKKAIQYQQGINAKMDAEYKTDAETLVQAYTPRP